MRGIAQIVTFTVPRTNDFRFRKLIIYHYLYTVQCTDTLWPAFILQNHPKNRRILFILTTLLLSVSQQDTVLRSPNKGHGSVRSINLQ